MQLSTVYNAMQKRADWGMPSGTGSYMSAMNRSGNYGTVNEVKGDVRNNYAEQSAKLKDPDYWKGMPQAAMRGLADSGWDTVKATNNLVLKGIPAAASALRNGTYSPIAATVNAARNGDMGTWWNEYSKQVDNTRADMAPMYTPANKVENYVNSVREYGRNNTWADPKGAQFNDRYKGVENAARMVGDTAQFMGWNSLTKIPGKAGKFFDSAWRMTGDPIWYSDSAKALGTVANKAGQVANNPAAKGAIKAVSGAAQKGINGYRAVSENWLGRRAVGVAGQLAGQNDAASVYRNPGSFINNLINTGIDTEYNASQAIAAQQQNQLQTQQRRATVPMQQQGQQIAATQQPQGATQRIPSPQETKQQPQLVKATQPTIQTKNAIPRNATFNA